jgi:hypothetical protein
VPIAMCRIRAIIYLRFCALFFQAVRKMAATRSPFFKAADEGFLCQFEVSLQAKINISSAQLIFP